MQRAFRARPVPRGPREKQDRAERQGKPRWGDKTPLYMSQLSLLDRLLPDALWVHLVRDGRDAALSFLELPEGFSGKTWAQPRTPAQFAARWRTEIRAARRLGSRAGGRYLELRYEDLVAEPERELRRLWDWYAPMVPYYIERAFTPEVPRWWKWRQARVTGWTPRHLS